MMPAVSNEQELMRVVDMVLRAHGFERRSCTWYRHHEDVILVVNVDKSPYGGQYFINLGLAIRSLNATDFPPEERCDIRIRLDRLAPNREDVLKAFDLEGSDLKGAERGERIMHQIEVGARWLNRLTTTSAVAQALASDAGLRNRATLTVRRYLNIEG